MNQKRVERVERRRPLIELNLQAGAKNRPAKRRRSCALPFLSALLVLLLPPVAVLLALR